MSTTPKYRKEYYEKNKKKLNKISGEYYEKNKKKIKRQSHDYYQKNKKKISDKFKNLSRKERDELNEKVRKRRKADPEKFHAIQLRYDYNLSLEKYKELCKNQKDCCAICKKHKTKLKDRGSRLCVDHCHKTGKIRGLLCQKCNRALGLFDDNKKSLNSAIKYLTNN